LSAGRRAQSELITHALWEGQSKKKRPKWGGQLKLSEKANLPISQTKRSGSGGAEAEKNKVKTKKSRESQGEGTQRTTFTHECQKAAIALGTFHREGYGEP